MMGTGIETSRWKLAITIAVFALSLGLVTQSLQSQSATINGLVFDELDQPVHDAWVLLTQVKTGIRRKLVTNEQGRWRAPFIANGYWTITAYTKEKISFPIIVRVGGGHTFSVYQGNFQLIESFYVDTDNLKSTSFQKITAPIELDLKIGSLHTLISAKKLMYQKDFTATVQLLQLFREHFSESKYLGNALYWLAYSKTKLAETEPDTREKEKGLEQSIDILNTLIDHTGTNDWKDDALIERVKVSQKLAQTGNKRGLKYILAGIENSTPELLELKMTSLDALMGIDPELALQYSIDLMKETPNPITKTQVIVILAKSRTPEALAFLRTVATQDPDKNVSATARFWLNRISRN